MKIYKRRFKEASAIYSLLRQEKMEGKINPLISKISSTIKWDTDLARSVCIHLLEDVNDHDMAKKIGQLLTAKAVSLKGDFQRKS